MTDRHRSQTIKGHPVNECGMALVLIADGLNPRLDSDTLIFIVSQVIKESLTVIHKPKNLTLEEQFILGTPPAI